MRFIEPPAAPPPKGGASDATPQVRNAQYREAQLQQPAPMPQYPARLLKAGLGPMTIGVHVTVDEDGQVSAITSSLYVISSIGPQAEEFRDAVEAAVRRWKFSPARIEHIETVTDQGFTYNRVSRTEKLEVEFDLAFTFTRDGRVQSK